MTQSRVLHPSMTSYASVLTNSSISSVATTSTCDKRYGVISRFGSNGIGLGLLGSKSHLGETRTTWSTNTSVSTSSLPITSSHTSSSPIFSPSQRSFASPMPSSHTVSSSVSLPTSSQGPVAARTSRGIIAGFYEYLRPLGATATTNSGLTSLVADRVKAESSDTTRATPSIYRRWQSAW